MKPENNQQNKVSWKATGNNPLLKNDYHSSIKKIINSYKSNILPVVLNTDFINSINTKPTALSNLGKIISETASENINAINTIINSINISDYISETIKHYQKIMDGILAGIKPLATSRLSGLDSNMLNKYYWVIPYEYDIEKIEELTKYKKRTDFEKDIINYYNKKRIKRLFKSLKGTYKERDKKKLIKQIEESFNNGNYAICITSLMTLFDSSTIILLAPGCINQHNSHNAVECVLEYINTRPFEEYSYELFIKVDILNNFIKKLYENINDLKGSNRKRLLSRHMNSHGMYYINNKINSLRLLDALRYSNEIIQEINLNEQFTTKRRNEPFKKIESNINN